MRAPLQLLSLGRRRVLRTSRRTYHQEQPLLEPREEVTPW